MTTETERRVPEHPGWQPWWLRRVEFDGHTVTLVLGREYRGYYITELWPGGGTWKKVDSLADAEAAFELACERLREGA